MDSRGGGGIGTLACAGARSPSSASPTPTGSLHTHTREEQQTIQKQMHHPHAHGNDSYPPHPHAAPPSFAVESSHLDRLRQQLHTASSHSHPHPHPPAQPTHSQSDSHAADEVEHHSHPYGAAAATRVGDGVNVHPPVSSHTRPISPHSHAHTHQPTHTRDHAHDDAAADALVNRRDELHHQPDDIELLPPHGDHDDAHTLHVGLGGSLLPISPAVLSVDVPDSHKLGPDDSKSHLDEFSLGPTLNSPPIPPIMGQLAGELTSPPLRPTTRQTETNTPNQNATTETLTHAPTNKPNSNSNDDKSSVHQSTPPDSNPSPLTGVSFNPSSSSSVPPPFVPPSLPMFPGSFLPMLPMPDLSQLLAAQYLNSMMPPMPMGNLPIMPMLPNDLLPPLPMLGLMGGLGLMPNFVPGGGSLNLPLVEPARKKRGRPPHTEQGKMRALKRHMAQRNEPDEQMMAFLLGSQLMNAAQFQAPAAFPTQTAQVTEENEYEDDDDADDMPQPESTPNTTTVSAAGGASPLVSEPTAAAAASSSHAPPAAAAQSDSATPTAPAKIEPNTMTVANHSDGSQLRPLTPVVLPAQPPSSSVLPSDPHDLIPAASLTYVPASAVDTTMETDINQTNQADRPDTKPTPNDQTHAQMTTPNRGDTGKEEQIPASSLYSAASSSSPHATLDVASGPAAVAVSIPLDPSLCVSSLSIDSESTSTPHGSTNSGVEPTNDDSNQTDQPTRTSDTAQSVDTLMIDGDLKPSDALDVPADSLLDGGLSCLDDSSKSADGLVGADVDDGDLRVVGGVLDGDPDGEVDFAADSGDHLATHSSSGSVGGDDAAVEVEPNEDNQIDLTGVEKEVDGANTRPNARVPRSHHKRRQSTNLECHECHKIYPDLGSLRKHAKIHKPREFQCTNCSMTFVDKSKLKRHQLVHSGDRPFVCYFPGCRKKFSLDFNLKSHVRVHTGERPYACDVQGCGRRFAQISNLKAHLRTHLNPTNPLYNVASSTMDIQASVNHAINNPVTATPAEAVVATPIANSLSNSLLAVPSKPVSLASNPAHSPAVVVAANPAPIAPVPAITTIPITALELQQTIDLSQTRALEQFIASHQRDQQQQQAARAQHDQRLLIQVQHERMLAAQQVQAHLEAQAQAHAHAAVQEETHKQLLSLVSDGDLKNSSHSDHFATGPVPMHQLPSPMLGPQPVHGLQSLGFHGQALPSPAFGPVDPMHVDHHDHHDDDHDQHGQHHQHQQHVHQHQHQHTVHSGGDDDDDDVSGHHVNVHRHVHDVVDGVVVHDDSHHEHHPLGLTDSPMLTSSPSLGGVGLFHHHGAHGHHPHTPMPHTHAATLHELAPLPASALDDRDRDHSHSHDVHHSHVPNQFDMPQVPPAPNEYSILASISGHAPFDGHHGHERHSHVHTHDMSDEHHHHHHDHAHHGVDDHAQLHHTLHHHHHSHHHTDEDQHMHHDEDPMMQHPDDNDEINNQVANHDSIMQTSTMHQTSTQ